MRDLRYIRFVCTRLRAHRYTYAHRYIYNHTTSFRRATIIWQLHNALSKPQSLPCNGGEEHRCVPALRMGVPKAIVFRKESSVRPRSIAKRGCRFVLVKAVYASRSRVYAFTMSVRYRSERDYASSANVNHRNSKLIRYDIDTRIPDTSIYI